MAATSLALALAVVMAAFGRLAAAEDCPNIQDSSSVDWKWKPEKWVTSDTSGCTCPNPTGGQQAQVCDKCSICDSTGLCKNLAGGNMGPGPHAAPDAYPGTFTQIYFQSNRVQ